MSQHGFNIRKFISDIRKHGVAYPFHYEIEMTNFGDSYELVFGKKNRDMMELLNMRLQTVTLPSATIASKGHNLMGIEREMPYGRIFEGDVSLLFLETHDYRIRKAFTEWQNKIVNPRDYTHGYYNDYTTTMNINTFTRKREGSGEVDIDVPNLNRIGPERPTAAAAAVGLGELLANRFQKQPDNFIEPPKPPVRFTDKIQFTANMPPVYSVRLFNVFPKSVNQIDLSAGSEELVKTEIVMSYRSWEKAGTFSGTLGDASSWDNFENDRPETNTGL